MQVDIDRIRELLALLFIKKICWLFDNEIITYEEILELSSWSWKRVFYFYSFKSISKRDTHFSACRKYYVRVCQAYMQIFYERSACADAESSFAQLLYMNFIIVNYIYIMIKYNINQYDEFRAHDHYIFHICLYASSVKPSKTSQ